MSAASRLGQALRNPICAAAWAVGKVFPRLLLANHSRLARRQGLQRTRLVLSFDCDTDRDIQVVRGVHDRLKGLGIRPVYAVPGELLERGAEVYASIAAEGAEFLNHGYRQHCRINPGTGTYESDVFYNLLSPQDLQEDVTRGHAAVLKVTGRAPRGFRVPHFGTFQGRSQLRFLYDTLRTLGCEFSTSTVPLKGLLGGPVQQPEPGFYELPVSGCYDMPLAILDSFGFRYAPGRVVAEADYTRQFGRMLDFFDGGVRPGLLNYYADPSQVFDWPDFFDCMRKAAPLAAGSYAEILNECRRGMRLRGMRRNGDA